MRFYSNFLLLTRTWEYASKVMNPAKLRIKSGGPSVKNACELGVFNENVMGEKVIVSEVNLYLRLEAADQLFLSAEIMSR